MCSALGIIGDGLLLLGRRGLMFAFLKQQCRRVSRQGRDIRRANSLDGGKGARTRIILSKKTHLPRQLRGFATVGDGPSANTWTVVRAGASGWGYHAVLTRQVVQQGSEPPKTVDRCPLWMYHAWHKAKGRYLHRHSPYSRLGGGDFGHCYCYDQTGGTTGPF